MQQLEQPLLHHGFAVAAGDAHHAGVMVAAVPGGQAVKRVPCIVHADRVASLGQCGRGVHQEFAHTALEHPLNVGMAVVVRALQCDEQGTLPRNRLARIHDQVLDPRVGIAGKRAADSVHQVAQAMTVRLHHGAALRAARSSCSVRALSKHVRQSGS